MEIQLAITILADILQLPYPPINRILNNINKNNYISNYYALKEDEKYSKNAIESLEWCLERLNIQYNNKEYNPFEKFNEIPKAINDYFNSIKIMKKLNYS
ncbi:MAG: hypothetical protein ACOCP8_00275 [archaeon]